MPEEQVTEEYAVYKREVWVQRVNVQASSLEEAVEKAGRGEGDVDENMPEYSHDLDLRTWTVAVPVCVDGLPTTVDYGFDDCTGQWKEI
jgi:hypothetical protein